jgi:hypothetical protein
VIVAILIALFAISSPLIFPAFACLARAFIQFAAGYSRGVSGFAREFMGGFAGTECRRILVCLLATVLSITLGLAFAFALTPHSGHRERKREGEQSSDGNGAHV